MPKKIERLPNGLKFKAGGEIWTIDNQSEPEDEILTYMVKSEEPGRIINSRFRQDDIETWLPKNLKYFLRKFECAETINQIQSEYPSMALCRFDLVADGEDSEAVKMLEDNLVTSFIFYQDLIELATRNF